MATSLLEAIQKHMGQASKASAAFNSLSGSDKNTLLTFLNSL